jgi:putative transposase
MASTYTELFYHFVWATKEREAMITAALEPHLLRYVRHKCDQLRVRVHALNGMPDHLHLACSLPTDLSVADFTEKLKGASSHFVNQLEDGNFRLYWQPGYGALTFSKRDLPRIVAYIDNQKQHHAANSLSIKMERLPAP